jgi:2-keto-3-deoxy-6-phosphogluconate aldolase
VIAHAIGTEVTPNLENAAAFLLGLTAMNIIPGVMRLSEIFRRNPGAALGRQQDTPQ